MGFGGAEIRAGLSWLCWLFEDPPDQLSLFKIIVALWSFSCHGVLQRQRTLSTWLLVASEPAGGQVDQPEETRFSGRPLVEFARLT